MSNVGSAQIVRCQKLLSFFESIGKDFSMKEFDDRIEFQKILYIAQQYGIDFEYPFLWYLKGPYSKSAANDGFLIEDLKNRQQLISNPKSNLNTQELEFSQIISDYKDDPIWLEVASSILYLRKESYGNESFDKVIGYLIEDLTAGYKNFDEELVRKVISDLTRFNLLK